MSVTVKFAHARPSRPIVSPVVTWPLLVPEFVHSAFCRFSPNIPVKTISF